MYKHAENCVHNLYHNIIQALDFHYTKKEILKVIDDSIYLIKAQQAKFCEYIKKLSYL